MKSYSSKIRSLTKEKEQFSLELTQARDKVIQQPQTLAITALVLNKGRGDTDWENASPPLVVVTLSEDMCIKVWHVVQGGREGGGVKKKMPFKIVSSLSAIMSRSHSPARESMPLRR